MVIYKVGEKSKALCSFCKHVVPTTFRERTVPLSSGKGEVAGVLAGVCDECDRVVSIPHQSVPRIKEALRTQKYAIEVRLPLHLMDILVNACDKLGVDAALDSQATLVRYYIDVFASSKSLSGRLGALAKSELAKGAAQASHRLSFKVTDLVHNDLVVLGKRTHLGKTDILKGIIIQTKSDILEGKSKIRMKDVRRLIRSTS